ncbi:MAG: serine hydrolase [Actinomycetota bacterium]|nr:serine hydrolase [Actinomycetota bacterium]
MTTGKQAEEEGVAVEGFVAPGFEPVREAFLANFTADGEVGAAVCVYQDGVPVVDLWGGSAPSPFRTSDQSREAAARAGQDQAEPPPSPYGRDTLQLVYSSTKGMTAVCAHLLVQRGELDLDAPVAHYWPEFAAAGKGAIPVRWLLSHRAGLPAIDARLSLDDVLKWDPVVDALAAQEPYWEPGTDHGYHALTFGWLVGEVVRRATGMSIGTFFAEEVAKPLGLDTWIGLPADEEPRVAPLPDAGLGVPEDLDPALVFLVRSFLGPESLTGRALSLNGAIPFGKGGNPFNKREVHAAEIPAAGGITDARSLARMYAALVGNVDGVRILDAERIAAAKSIESNGPDRVLVFPSVFGEGFMCHDPVHSPLLGPGSFGHSGAGGSLGFADADADIGFGYVMNRMLFNFAGDPRNVRLIDGLRQALR